MNRAAKPVVEGESRRIAAAAARGKGMWKSSAFVQTAMLITTTETTTQK
jgi:hypothetical protein